MSIEGVSPDAAEQWWDGLSSDRQQELLALNLDRHADLPGWVVSDMMELGARPIIAGWTGDPDERPTPLPATVAQFIESKRQETTLD